MRMAVITGLAVAALTTAAGTMSDATASMHLRLTRSAPAKDSSYATAPTAIKLWYSQEPQLRLSSVTLTGPHGAVALGKVAQDSADKKILTAAVEGELHPGNYTIAWRTASSDGHPIRGTIPFTLRGE